MATACDSPAPRLRAAALSVAAATTDPSRETQTTVAAAAAALPPPTPRPHPSPPPRPGDGRGDQLAALRELRTNVQLMRVQKVTPAASPTRGPRYVSTTLDIDTAFPGRSSQTRIVGSTQTSADPRSSAYESARIARAGRKPPALVKYGTARAPRRRRRFR